MSSDIKWASRRGYFVIAAAILALDQLSKLIVHFHLADRGAVEVIPGLFSLWYSRNAGGLFGSFREWSGPLRFVLLTLLPTIAVLFIAGFLRRGRIHDRPTLLGLSLILGGATGNLIDRLFRGEVIDFLDVYLSDSSVAAHDQTGVDLHVPLIPVQLYQMTADLLLAGLLTWLWRRKLLPDGTVAWLFMLLYSVSRGLIEFWRGDSQRGMWFQDRISTSQMIAIFTGLFAIAMLLRGGKWRWARGGESAEVGEAVP